MTGVRPVVYEKYKHFVVVYEIFAVKINLVVFKCPL